MPAYQHLAYRRNARAAARRQQIRPPKNLETLQQKDGIVGQLNSHRQRLMQAVINGEPEKARQASNDHLAFIEEAMLEVGKERSRIERSLRRTQQG